jgi:hypothetical protein
LVLTVLTVLTAQTLLFLALPEQMALMELTVLMA